VGWFCRGFLGFSGVFHFPSLSCFGVLLYISYMFRGAFTLFIKFTTCQKKKKKALISLQSVLSIFSAGSFVVVNPLM
jgi:hypothetical protein